MSKCLKLLGLVATGALLLVGCGANDGTSDASTDGPITVYSGRDEELIKPLLDAFTAQTGIEVEARYANSAELALLIETEGDSSPADVFISQSPGALGHLVGQDRLIKLDPDLLEPVASDHQDSDGHWVGLTGRVRVLVYNSETVSESELPSSILELTAPEFAGRVGVAPSNGSFQDFVTAMRQELGDDATGQWLEAMGANQAPNYTNNSAIVEAVGRGELDMGLVNHYYNLRALEADPSLPSRNHFFPGSDLGAVVLVTGAGVLDTSDQPETAQSLIKFLLSAEAQQMFSGETQEYPLAKGMAGPEGLPPLDGFATDTIDFEVLGQDLTGTRELIVNSGIER